MENKSEFGKREPLTRVIGDEASFAWLEGEFTIGLAIDDFEENFLHPEITTRSEKSNLEIKFIKADSYTEVYLAFREEELYADNIEELKSLLGEKIYHMCLAYSRDLSVEDKGYAFKQENIGFDTDKHASQIQRWLLLRDQALEDK